jgi:hypothetical protein
VLPRPVQQLRAPQPGHHEVVDRTPHRHQGEHPPQGARVCLRAPRPIPLVHSPVTATLVGGQPQFRHKPREAHEQRGVEQAFPAENGVPEAAHRAQPELHHQYTWIPRRAPVDHRLPVHPRRCPVSEPQPHPHLPRRQMNPALPQQSGRRRDAAGQRPQRRPVGKRRLLSHNSARLVPGRTWERG